MEKNYSWAMTLQRDDGTVKECNVTNVRKGYKQSWYSTEEKARKALEERISWTTGFGEKILSWKIFNRNGIIEEG